MCAHISASMSVCVCVGGQALTGVVLNTDNCADVLQLRRRREKLLLPTYICLVPEIKLDLL